MVRFTGGDKMVAALADIAKKLSKATTLQVGFMEDANYPDGKPVAMVAALQEWGAPKASVPPRPFFRSMIAAKSPEWGPGIAQALVDSGYDSAQALGKVGQAIKGQLEESIIATDSPPLSPVTVMLRGMRRNNPDLVVTAKTVGEAAARVAAGKTNYGASDEPLNDTGHMLASVTARVK